MRIIKWCSAIFLVAAFNSCMQPVKLAESFRKFEGRWIAADGDGQYIEVWKPGSAPDILVEGYAFSLKGTDSSLHENISITATDSGIYYMVASPSQNSGATVGFKLMPFVNDSVMSFENPTHDFPTKIVYTFKGSDSLHVEVGAADRKFELLFSRKQQR